MATKKDNRNKDVIVADLNEKEQRLEAMEKELEEARAATAKAEERAAEAEKNAGANVVAPVVSSVGSSSTKPGQPSPAPDSKFHFNSLYRQYQIPGAKFFDHRFVTGNAAVVDKLKKHKAFGSEFWLTHAPVDSKEAA